MEQRNSTPPTIDEILQSLDGMQKAETPPFFYTRLQAKLDKRSEPSAGNWSWVTRPAFSLVTLGLLLLLNVAAITGYLKQQRSSSVNQTSGIEKFAAEYNLDGSSVYNDKP